MMRIEYLCDHIGFADTVARWIYDEFIAGIKVDLSYEDILAAITKCCRQKLPMRLIALVDDTCVGTVSLVQNDLRCREYSPWLAALYVDKDYRNQGIGEQLINAVIDVARKLGHEKLYLRTEHASDYYRKLGWAFVETCEDDYDLKPDVFVCDFLPGLSQN